MKIKSYQRRLIDQENAFRLRDPRSRIYKGLFQSEEVGIPNPVFQAQLKNTIVPDIGTGMPTLSRTTTATVTDFEGAIHDCQINEARFRGARRVANNALYSQDFSNAAWDQLISSVTIQMGIPDPEGGTCAQRLTANGNNAALTQDNIHREGINTINSIWIRRVSGSGNIEIYKGNGTTRQVVTVTSSWQRVEAEGIASSSIDRYGINITTSGDVIETAFYQSESKTGTQTAASEYVATNVLSAPYYGAGVDGVRYFTTDRNGDPINDETLVGYLSEQQQTNLCTTSEDFTATSAFWNALGLNTRTANVETAPDGSLTADRIQENSQSGFHGFIHSSIPTISGRAYTYSLFVKPIGRDVINFTFPSDLGNGKATFDLANLTTADVNTVSRIDDYAGGWYRIEATVLATANGAASSQVRFALSDGTDNYTGSSLNAFYLWGGQISESNSGLSVRRDSYIRTDGTTITRTADSLTYTADDITQGEGSYTIQPMIYGYPGSTQGVISINNGTAAYVVLESWQSSTALSYIQNVSTQSSISAPRSSIDLAAYTRSGTSYKENEVKYFIQGTKEGEDLLATIPTNLNTINIGASTAGTSPLNGTIRNVNIYGESLTEDQMITLTTPEYLTDENGDPIRDERGDPIYPD